MNLHDPATCSQCISLREAVERGELVCYGSGHPCDLCQSNHEVPRS